MLRCLTFTTVLAAIASAGCSKPSTEKGVCNCNVGEICEADGTCTDSDVVDAGSDTELFDSTLPTDASHRDASQTDVGGDTATDASPADTAVDMSAAWTPPPDHPPRAVDLFSIHVSADLSETGAFANYSGACVVTRRFGCRIMECPPPDPAEPIPDLGVITIETSQVTLQLTHDGSAYERAASAAERWTPGEPVRVSAAGGAGWPGVDESLSAPSLLAGTTLGADGATADISISGDFDFGVTLDEIGGGSIFGVIVTLEGSNSTQLLCPADPATATIVFPSVLLSELGPQAATLFVGSEDRVPITSGDREITLLVRDATLLQYVVQLVE